LSFVFSSNCFLFFFLLTFSFLLSEPFSPTFFCRSCWPKWLFKCRYTELSTCSRFFCSRV
jgi:hypothetical protein